MNEINNINENGTSKRSELVRNTIVFQLKLMADGFRDLVLIPVSLVAAVIGLLRGGDDPEREFEQVIEIGRQSEQWINLFGNHDVPADSHMGTSIDVVISKVEGSLKQQYEAGKADKNTQAESDETVQPGHKKTRSEELEG